MLFLLTGNKQTGKTRWLEKTINELQTDGVKVAGVIAPGIWKEQPDGTREKLGINNILLPENRCITFAQRLDLIRDTTFTSSTSSQSKRTDLGWLISDDALSCINVHFDHITKEACSWNSTNQRALVVIDEIGKLELNYGEGITSALSFLDQGATPAFPHALAVVRPSLIQKARLRFADAPWNGMRVINLAQNEQLEDMTHFLEQNLTKRLSNKSSK